jgi:hypothetical protein
MKEEGSRAKRIFTLALSAVAAVTATSWFLESLGVSHIERDDAAGLNGSFEVVRSGFPVNWHIHDRPIEDGDYELDFDTDAMDGQQSLELRVHRVTGPGWRGPGLFQVIDAVEGNTYSVRFWMKNEGCLVKLRIDSETPESRDPRRPINVRFEGAGLAEGVWEEFEYTYTVPKHYQNIRFDIDISGGSGTVWLDDVRIEPKPER